MGKTIGRFNYDIFGGPKHKPIPTSAIAQITLQHWTKSENGAPIISPHLMTEMEIEQYIEDLKKDLDAVGRNAKKDLGKCHPAQIKNT